MSRSPHTLAAVVLLLALPPPQAAAQELELFLARGSSENASLSEPRGRGLAFGRELGGWVRVVAEVSRASAAVDRFGRTCRQIEPVDRFCIDEPIEGTTRLTAVEVSALVAVRPLPFVRLAVGGGPVIAVVDTDATGVSGRLADQVVPGTAAAGLSGLVEASLVPGRLPLVLRFALKRQVISMDGCLGDALTFEPFCGTQRLTRMQLGLGWVL